MNQELNFLKARKELNLSQAEIAEKAGVSRETVSNTERGKNISYPYILYLVEQGYSKDWLLGDSSCEKFTQKKEEQIDIDNDLQKRLTQLEKENSMLKAENRSLRDELLDLHRMFKNLYQSLNVNIDLGKHKASSNYNVATLSEKELMYKLNFSSQG